MAEELDKQSYIESEDLINYEKAIIESYADSVCRLTKSALAKAPKQNLGWSDSFRRDISTRHINYELDNEAFQLRDFTDNDQPNDSLPLQIRLITQLSPISNEKDNKVYYPIEFKFFTPAQNKLNIVRLDAVDKDLLNNQERLREIFDLEKEFNPITVTDQDYYVFCLGIMLAIK